jgi:hypothetical protein
MPIKYECDRCDKDAVTHITVSRKTPRGTPTRTSDYWLCTDHLKEFDVAVTRGAARASLHPGREER